MSGGTQESGVVESDTVELRQKANEGAFDAMIDSGGVLSHQTRSLLLALHLHAARQYGLLPPCLCRSTPPPYRPPYTSWLVSGMARD
jgi:hypothetical protein